MGITAKELAKKLNLSATAVSMALNSKPGVSIETRNLVIAEAEKNGYDFSKLSLKKHKNESIYCIIYRSNNAILNYSPIFSEITDGIEQECRANGYSLKVLQIYEHSDDVTKCIEELRIIKCAGVILLGTEITASVCKLFLQLSIPLILLDSYFDSVDCNSITINNIQGAYTATNYLIDRCGKQPGYLASTYSVQNFKERRKGFERAVREHGMSVGNTITHYLSPSIDGAFTDMMEILNNNDNLAKCYFADNDLIAIGCIKALKLSGYNIPEDIAVIGFDNISEAKIIDPALTTISIPRHFMGQTAVKQLIHNINTPIPHTLKIEVTTSLVKRFSV